MGQDLTADFTVSSEPKFGDPLPSFRIYAEHYLICWSISRKGWVGGEYVCASSGCSRLVTQCGCRLCGQMLLYAASSFFITSLYYTPVT